MFIFLESYILKKEIRTKPKDGHSINFPTIIYKRYTQSNIRIEDVE